MELLYSALLGVVAFWLGACPFSVWIGYRFLGKDITEYGDHNPGAANVFRAGGRGFGLLAVFADVSKGAPPILLARFYLELPEPSLYAMALLAVLGHMYSPFLGFRGGKATATTIGVMLVLPHLDVSIVFLLLMAVVFLFVEMESDAWEVMLSGAGMLAYTVFAGKGTPMYVFLVCLLIILGVKHFHGLCEAPRVRFKPISWFFTLKRLV
ncbi:MAG: glycerol-3-phosphate acyltransferase [Dehalococcoidia bacterium]|nr:glycerol-3-phosphate acyltransferase [Dehalococcoidia bacterium]